MQIVNEGDSSLATELQEEPEESPGPVVDENIVSAKKQGQSTHNWSGDWSFWVVSFNLEYKFSLILQQFI